MAIALAASGTAVYDTAAGTTTSVPYPAGIAAGDCLVLFVARSASAITVPAGWTAFSGGQVTTTGGTTMLLAFKLAVGTESGSLAVTVASGTGHSRMFRFTGVNQTTPQDVTAGTATANATTTILPTITTVTAGACVIGAGTNGGAVGGTYTISDGTYTEDDDSGQAVGASNGRNAALYHLIKAATGATGTKTLTHANARAVGVHGALRPAAGSTTSITVTATAGSTPTVARQAGHPVTPSAAASTPTIVRQPNRLLAPTAGSSPSVTRAATRLQAPTASASSTATVDRQAQHTATAVLGQVPLATEDFGGTVASGWSALDSTTIGATGWTILGGTASTFAENSGTGQQTPVVGGAISRMGAGVSMADGEVLAKVAFSAIPGTATYQAYLFGRYQGLTTWYRAFFQLTAAGVLQTKIQRQVAGVNADVQTFGTTDATYAANRFYWCRYQWVGEAHRARFWLDGDPEPSVWIIDTTDPVASGGFITAGNIGLGALAGAGSAGVTVSWDGFRIYDPAAGAGAATSVTTLRVTGRTVTATGSSTPSLARTPQLVRAVTAASSTAITKRPGLVRALAQAATATAQQLRTRIAASTVTNAPTVTASASKVRLNAATVAAASSAAITKALTTTRTVTNAASATVTALRVRVRAVTAAGTGTPTIIKRPALTRSTTGPSSSTATRRPALVRSVVAGSSTSATRTPARTILATATSATSLIRRPAHAVSTLAGSAASVGASTRLTVSTAAGAATAITRRALHLVDLAATSALDTLQALVAAGQLKGRKGGNNRIGPARTQPSIIQAIVMTPAQGRAHGRSAIPSEDGRVTYSPVAGTGIIEGGD